MNKKTVHAARLALAAATLAGMTGCCWMKCPCKRDCCPAKPCDTTDCTTSRNVDLNVVGRRHERRRRPQVTHPHAEGDNP